MQMVDILSITYCAAATAVLTVIGFVYDNLNFRPPPSSSHNQLPLTDCQKIWQRSLHQPQLPLYQIWCKSAYDDGFWANMWNITKMFYLFIPFWGEGNSPTDQTCLQILAFGWNYADSHKGVCFGGFIDIPLYLGFQIVQKPEFWGHE